MPLILTGINPLNARLESLAIKFPEAAAEALNVVAEETMTDAKQRTPVDHGPLRRSGKVHKHAEVGSLSADLSFGTEYAIAVHEHPGPHDPPSWRGNTVHFSPSGTGPKFLENAIKFTAATFAARIANAIARRTGGGGRGAGSPGGVGNL